LKAPDEREVDCRLRQWSAGKVSSVSPQPFELETGDRIQFTRNHREAGRLNGGQAEVTQSRTGSHTRPPKLAWRDPDAGLENPSVEYNRYAYVETTVAAKSEVGLCPV
jgi:hypothetical protein